MLDSGKAIGFPDGLLINGRGLNGYTFTVQPGKYFVVTYSRSLGKSVPILHFCNCKLTSSLN